MDSSVLTRSLSHASATECYGIRPSDAEVVAVHVTNLALDGAESFQSVFRANCGCGLDANDANNPCYYLKLSPNTALKSAERTCHRLG